MEAANLKIRNKNKTGIKILSNLKSKKQRLFKKISVMINCKLLIKIMTNNWSNLKRGKEMAVNSQRNLKITNNN